MQKGALILYEVADSAKCRTLFDKAKELFCRLLPNNIETTRIEEDEFEVSIVRIPKISPDKLEGRLEKVFEWIQAEGIGLVSFCDYIQDEHEEFMQRASSNIGVKICSGDNIFFSIVVRTLKKLVKSKGLDLNEIDMAVVTDGNSRYEKGFVKYLLPYVKYLTYICSESTKIKRNIDDIFNENGCSVRVCTDISECIKDVALVINLTPGTLNFNGYRGASKIVVYNAVSSGKTSHKDIAMLNGINIDISSKINVSGIGDTRYLYSLCEMYILSHLNRLDLLDRLATESELKEISECFKQSGFKVAKLDGTNL